MFKALLKVGSNIELKNQNNKTPFEYMEDIEQLNSMFNAHYPGLWTAVEKSQINNIEKLLNGKLKTEAFFIFIFKFKKFSQY